MALRHQFTGVTFVFLRKIPKNRPAMRIKRFKKHKNWWHKLQFWKKTKPDFPWKLSVIGGIIAGIVLLLLYIVLVLPDVRNADQLSFAESTIIYARGALDPGENPNDHILYTIHGDENREYIPLAEISPWVKEATLAIEDDQFYHHFGFDIGGIGKAALNHFLGIGNARGGSTITQQLVKNTFLNNDRSIIRKFNELLLSIKLELTHSKDEILELYLNKIPYGNNAYGIEAAAKTYFDKSARELTIAESAVLASLPVAPSRFNPFGSNRDVLMGFYELENSYRTEEEARAAEEESDENKVKVYKKGRKDLVLQRMLDLKMITQNQFQQAWAEAIGIEFKTARSDIKAPHFVFYVRERVEEKYGKEFLNQGGLRIYTTLDLSLQETAEQIVAEKTDHYADTYGAKNLALTAIENASGEIWAYIGGKDFFDEKNDGQVDVLTSRRQPGSSFKPMVYAAGFAQGYAPGNVVFDAETDFGNNYKPQNFDEEFRGPVNFRRALNESLNIPAIKMAYLATPARVLQFAELLGVKYEGDADRHGVAIGVGVAEVEPLSHINSFQAFAGDGGWHSPTAILEIRNADDKLLEKTDTSRRQQDGLDPEVAALVRSVLTDQRTRAVTDGFAWNKLLQLAEYDNGAKTGTSNRVVKNPEFNEDLPESRNNEPFISLPGDSWTVGFTPHLITGVWVGNNRGEPMKSGATGLAVAAPVWKSFTEAAHEQFSFDPEIEYETSVKLKAYNLNKFSGGIATEDTPEELIVTDYFASFGLPKFNDRSVQEKEINLLTGEPAEEDDPDFVKETRKVLVLRSLRPDLPAWLGPTINWINAHPKFINSLGAEHGTGWDEIDIEELRDAEENRQVRKESLRERIRRLRGQTTTPVDGTAPEIRIITPTDGGDITPGRIQVQVAATASAGIRAVEYYFNDQFVDEAIRAPYLGEFTLPSNFETGSEHVLRAVAIDQNYQSTSTEVVVNIASDNYGPSILIASPFANQQVPANSLFEVQALVEDSSAVASVEILRNGVSQAVFDGPPYRAQLVADDDLGRVFIEIQAEDVHGNTSKKSIPIMIGKAKVIRISNPQIDSITDNRASLTVAMTFPDPDEINRARVRVANAGKTLHVQELEQITQIASLNLLRTVARGSAIIELQIDTGGGWKTVSAEAVDF